MPKTPFFMGGEYKLENLWAGNPLEGMRLKGDLAIQTRDLPSGTRVRLNIAPKPVGGGASREQTPTHNVDTAGDIEEATRVKPTLGPDGRTLEKPEPPK
jgi:hypothetical protein